MRHVSLASFSPKAGIQKRCLHTILPRANFLDPRPWAEDDDPLDAPAVRWGVATDHERVLLCGSGARRGGAVSGIGGHNAAMAALELLG